MYIFAEYYTFETTNNRNMVYNLLAVFLGSGIGGVLRWLLGTYLNGNYPIGTFVANILGCFLIGMFSKLLPGDPHLKLVFVTGFCGGFTTFSTFINENFMLLRGSQLIVALCYMLVSLVCGLIACWVGYNLLCNR